MSSLRRGGAPAICLGLALFMAAGCGGRHRVALSDSTDRHDSAAWLQGRMPVRPLLIRVGLAATEPRAILRASGPVFLLQGEDRRQIVRLQPEQEITVYPAGDRLRWVAGRHQGSASSLFVQPCDPAHDLSWQEGSYHGEFLLLPGGQSLTVVNVVSLEEYLGGVVPWEIGRPGPEAMAALEAQAVAARTYTISHLGARAELGFDIWADVQDQVYRGRTDEDPDCNAAIQHTAGLVLRHDGAEIEAYYCSTCGGQTSNIEEVWPLPGRSYLRSHRDVIGEREPFCAGSRHFAWSVSWSAAELERILQRTLPEYVLYMSEAYRIEWAEPIFTPRQGRSRPDAPGRLLGLSPIRRTTSGRIGQLDIATEAGVYHIRGDRVRWVLVPPDGNPAILRSALFQLDVDVGEDGRLHQLTAAGHGYGHGIGMCQIGALAMATEGYSSREILAHYYPGARLERWGGLP